MPARRRRRLDYDAVVVWLNLQRKTLNDNPYPTAVTYMKSYPGEGVMETVAVKA